ncbi:MAG: mannose-1-phosphate guanylyltransferase/mannose-6-phosphate isomerase, partial [Burkholderiales bacterium]
GLAETGYGYIRVGPEFEPFVRPRAYCVDQFVEKPDLATARSYVGSGEYLWNSGIFALRASVWLAALERLRPEMLEACERAWRGGSRQGDALLLDDAAFCDCPEDSIDYAVMERLGGAGSVARAAVVRLEAGWSDVGAWDALWQIGRKDYDGNVVHGDVCALETRDALLYSQHRLVACVGLSGVVVVETPDAVLVARRDKGQQVKEVVARLKRETRAECVNHRKVHRPWGSYDSVDLGDRFQVKRITVNPGASLSLQRHYHRAEHWIVVSGTARITRGDEELLLAENQSIHIPLGVMHRLANPGKLPLQVIEVQTGAYLGEDDIERHHDAYGRADRALALAPAPQTQGGRT